MSNKAETVANPVREARWERRPDDRPQELLDAAIGVFAEKGYHGAKMEEIAAAAGVGKGTVYHYFPNKEALLGALVDRAVQTRIVPAEEFIHDDWRAPASVKLRLLLERARENILSREASTLTRIIICDVSQEAPALFHKWVELVLLRGARVTEELIADGQWNGEFRRDIDPRVAARFLGTAVQMQIMLYAGMGVAEIDPIGVERLLDTTLSIFLRGLAPQPPSELSVRSDEEGDSEQEPES